MKNFIKKLTPEQVDKFYELIKKHREEVADIYAEGIKEGIKKGVAISAAISGSISILALRALIKSMKN